MRRTRLAAAVLGLVGIVTIVGCTGPQHDMAAMKDMKPPPRPAELDRLEMWVGTWEGTMEMHMAGAEKPMQWTGKSVIQWEVDKHVLVERSEGDMGEMGKMIGLAVYSWDPYDKTYRSCWFDNWGCQAQGTMAYNEAKKTWSMYGKGRDACSGATTIGEGTMEVVDDNTTKWTYCEWDSWKFHKKMWGSGTMKRVAK